MKTKCRALMTVRVAVRLAVAVVSLVLLAPRPIVAANAGTYVLVIVGAPGSPELAATHTTWMETLVGSLTGPLGIARDRVIALGGSTSDSRSAATAINVRAALGNLQQRTGPDDTVAVVLIGHGTWDGASAKFNLVGPDLEVSEWNRLLAPFRCQLVIVNTTAASAPFLSELAGSRRTVITATSSAAQRFDTVFPQFFVAGLTDADADLDKDERVSVWEAFTFASVRVRRYYEQRGQLATEHAVLDDTGDGIGKEAGEKGPDGAVASRTFLDAGPPIARSASPAISELLSRRERLLADLDELKRKRTFMPAADYSSELERLLVEIARVSQEIRRQS